MEYQSCFDIIGPIMVGPSSSHTAGVVSIGKFIHQLVGGCPEVANIVFYDSFAETYQGHGTDKALLGGLIGLKTDDLRIKQSLELAEKYGVKYELEFDVHCDYYPHPNTVVVKAKRGDRHVKVGGVSLGGGISKVFLVNEELVDIRLSTDDDHAALAKEFQLCGKVYPRLL